MLKKPITYTDFDDKEVTEDFYFNLTKTELMTLEAETPGGLAASLQRIGQTRDFNRIVAEFKRIVLAAYGERSEDGKRFVKTDQIREEFQQTAAWDALFFELATSAGAAEAFVKGVFPKDLEDVLQSVTVERLAAQNQPTLPGVGTNPYPELPSFPPPAGPRGD
jgi:hypothetical protein